MTSMIELEAMRLDILNAGTKDGNLLKAFADGLNQLLRGEGFTTTYLPKQTRKGSTVIVVEGPAYQIAVGISPYFPYLIKALDYVDASTVQGLVAGLHENCKGQVDIAYCQQCDYFHIDWDGGCNSCLLDLEMKAGCPQRRIKGT